MTVGRCSAGSVVFTESGELRAFLAGEAYSGLKPSLMKISQDIHREHGEGQYEDQRFAVEEGVAIRSC
ncbi:hypothetical protein ACH4VM_20020 [Streptomyces sp. NPDC020792]|uniref:hypothetical protein n=1 Tax=Streptomyces sp. NPDC020792 TaxID=3365089 RepID=UPI0037A0AFA7